MSAAAITSHWAVPKLTDRFKMRSDRSRGMALAISNTPALEAASPPLELAFVTHYSSPMTEENNLQVTCTIAVAMSLYRSIF